MGKPGTVQLKVGDLRTPRFTISITENLIAEAERQNSGHCMIAEAIKAQVPNVKKNTVAVDLQTIRWTDTEKNRRYIYLTPRIAQNCLLRFDQGIPTPTFSFKLRDGQSVKAGSNSSKKHQLPGIAECQSKAEPSEKKRMVKSKGAAGQGNGVPAIIGGRAPAQGALAGGPGARGKRREFGIRGSMK